MKPKAACLKFTSLYADSEQSVSLLGLIFDKISA